MRKVYVLFVALPLLSVFILTGCSEETPETEEPKVEEEKPKEPLIEREPEVKEYFEVYNDVVDEYITVGETILSTVESLDSGDLGLLETAAAAQELYESWDKLEDLNKALEQQGTIKENIEANLNPKDILEFKNMYEESYNRVEDLIKRVEAIDYDKYLK